MIDTIFECPSCYCGTICFEIIDTVIIFHCSYCQVEYCYRAYSEDWFDNESRERPNYGEG